MKYFLKEVKQFKWFIMMSICLVIISVAAQLLQPQILNEMITAIVNLDSESLVDLGLKLVLFSLAGLLAGITNTVIAAKVTQQVGANFRALIFNKVQTFSFTDIEKFSASNLAVRLVNDTQQVQGLVMILMQALTRIPILFIGSVILSIMTFPSLWWVILLMIAIVGAVAALTFSRLEPRFSKVQTFIERINTSAKENFVGMRVVKSFVQEQAQNERFSAISLDLTKEIIGIGIVFSLMFPFFTFVMNLAQAMVVFIVGFYMDLTPDVIGSTVAFVSFMSMVMMTLLMGSMFVSFASRATISLKRIEEVLDTESTMVEGEISNAITRGDLHFNNVSFTYPGAQEPSLRNLEFSIHHGQTVGIVGKTGSGKTSLVQLMGRLYDPTTGSIEIDGVSLQDYKETTVHDAVSIVLQNPVLFSGTIRDILWQGKRDASIDEMIWASQLAQAWEFIEKDPDLFEKEVYQRGTNFSGGQKQRLSIARGIIRKPKILVLDDSTSALDAKSESLVQEALLNEMKETTKVIVSQKISSIVKADLILVLEKGSIVDQGTHESLLSSSTVYQEIYQSQQGKDNGDAQ